MSTHFLPYEQLPFTNNFIFCKVLSHNLELTRQLLQLILQIPVREVKLSEAEKAVEPTPASRGVRFDVYAEDAEGSVFDIEMQTTHKKNIARRSRYYQSVSDIDHLDKGMKYGALPNMYVIFICMFDPFGEGLARYEFRNLCMEGSRLELGDGTCKIFINARSKRNDVPPELKSLMDYLCGKEPCSNLTRYISDSIRKAKDNRRWDHNTDNMPDS